VNALLFVLPLFLIRKFDGKLAPALVVEGLTCTNKKNANDLVCAPHPAVSYSPLGAQPNLFLDRRPPFPPPCCVVVFGPAPIPPAAIYCTYTQPTIPNNACLVLLTRPKISQRGNHIKCLWGPNTKRVLLWTDAKWGGGGFMVCTREQRRYKNGFFGEERRGGWVGGDCVRRGYTKRCHKPPKIKRCEKRARLNITRSP
jgi:hypothetical protein